MPASRGAIALTLASPGLAMAHSPLAGSGRLLDGLLHPLMTLPHTLALLLFALLVGLHGSRVIRIACPPFLFSFAAGLLLAVFAIAVAVDSSIAVLALSSLAGLLAATAWSSPPVVITILAVLLGLMLGADHGLGGLSARQSFIAALGCWLGGLILVLSVAVVADFARRPWQRQTARTLAALGTGCSLLLLWMAWSG
jgi:hydrogenase/urease accessory protein HupE